MVPHEMLFPRDSLWNHMGNLVMLFPRDSLWNHMGNLMMLFPRDSLWNHMGNLVILFFFIIWGTMWWISFRKFLD
jgi:hypothetical protein